MQAMSSASELEHLWRDSSARLRVWFERHTNAADAEDLVQETFIRVHERLDTLLDAASVRAWLGTIARNVLVDHRRRATRAADVSALPDPPQPDDSGPGMRENLDLTVAGWLDDHLRELEPADAEALRVVDLEGRTHKELAERQGLSLSGAKSRVQRARTKLRARLEDCCAFAFDARGGILSYEKRRRECCEDERCG